jgi:HSP20 family protein
MSLSIWRRDLLAGQSATQAEHNGIGRCLGEAEVPGFTAKDLEIQIEGRRLTISGKRESSEEQKKGTSIFQEHRSNEIQRVVDLPTEVDVSKATATLKNGIVGLQLPKNVKAKSTRIDVKAA